ncbi:MAG: hypothetical protein ACLQRH_14000, partial [Acidimicrobiales bacterium]
GVWRAVQHELATPSQALDVLGRGANPYDLSLVTPHAAVEQAIMPTAPPPDRSLDGVRAALETDPALAG